MLSFALFILSGAAIATLILAKRFEMRRRKPNFVIEAISKSDEHMRDFHHKSLHLYTLGKEKTSFWIKKQLPLHSKFWWNKSLSYIREQLEKYADEMRDAKLLRQSDGLSEFFKTVSQIEKGNGDQ